MAQYEGIATMYLSMPMSNQTLPIMGSCSVQDKKISLRFPLTTVSFDLPESPREGGKDMEFKMGGGGPRGDMTLKIAFKRDLNGFLGQGQQDGQNVVTFTFFKPDSGLKHLKSL